MKLRLNNKLRYSLYAVLAAVLLSSCGNEPVIHTEDNPFIIGRIEKVDDNKWRYERQEWDVTLGNFASTGKQSITVDKQLPYQVGDTLRLYCR
jgi:hypothetical protein